MEFDLENAIQSIDKPWTPLDLATFNNNILRIALFEGEYHEHDHDYDEFFYVYKGKIKIWTEKGDLELAQGQGGVVLKGIKHKPIALEPSYVIMIDRTE